MDSSFFFMVAKNTVAIMKGGTPNEKRRNHNRL